MDTIASLCDLRYKEVIDCQLSPSRSSYLFRSLHMVFCFILVLLLSCPSLPNSYCIVCREEMLEEPGGDELLDLGASGEKNHEQSTLGHQDATSRDRCFARVVRIDP